MAKAKSKNPIGRPRFEVTPEGNTIGANRKSYGARLNQRAMRRRTLVFHALNSLNFIRNKMSDFSDAIKKGEARGIERCDQCPL
jgi:hypothetical protein